MFVPEGPSKNPAVLIGLSEIPTDVWATTPKDKLVDGWVIFLKELPVKVWVVFVKENAFRAWSPVEAWGVLLKENAFKAWSSVEAWVVLLKEKPFKTWSSVEDWGVILKENALRAWSLVDAREVDIVDNVILYGAEVLIAIAALLDCIIVVEGFVVDPKFGFALKGNRGAQVAPKLTSVFVVVVIEEVPNVGMPVDNEKIGAEKSKYHKKYKILVNYRHKNLC